MNKDNLAMFPLISALAGYRLVVFDDKLMPGVKDTDIMVSRSLYNKMKELCPDLFNEKEKI